MSASTSPSLVSQPAPIQGNQPPTGVTAVALNRLWPGRRFKGKRRAGDLDGALNSDAQRIHPTHSQGSFLPNEGAPLSAREQDAEESELLDHATAFMSSPVPSGSDLPRLAKPVLIPRLNPSFTFPYARAWPEATQEQGISQSDWLSFVDNLNILSLPHPSIILAQVAAIGIAFAPIEGANGLVSLIEVFAAISAEIIAKARCDRFLQLANTKYFHPRGLHARMVDTKTVRRSLGLPKDVKLIAPLSEDTLDMSAQQRCLEFLKDYTSHLTWDVPEPSQQTKRLAKLAAWRVKRKVREMDTRARCSRRRAWKKHQKGKNVKREGWAEGWRANKLNWLFVQDLEDYEKEKNDIAEEVALKKATRTWSLKRASTLLTGGEKRGTSAAEARDLEEKAE